MQKIKQLRDITGVGIVDCKNALKQAGDDIEKAIEILRKSGIAKATKRKDREAKEGIIKVATNKQNNKGYIIEINSETDFVGRNAEFQKFSEQVIELIKNSCEPNNSRQINSLEELESMLMENSKTVKENLDNLSSVVGEKLNINRFDILTGSTVAAYSHLNGKIGVLIALDKENEKDLALDIAMQIAATNPKYINTEDVPDEEIEKEKEIFKEQLLKQGKQENMIDKILLGKISKYFEEICLIKQEYIKEDKKTVENILGNIKITGFIRYCLA